MQAMMRRLAGMAAVCVLGSVVGCNAESKLASNSELAGGLWTVSIKSSAFKNSEAIPERYTQDGANMSPPLSWSKGPSGLKEWALIVQDPDAKTKEGYPETNWAVYKIPADVTELPEGASRTLKNPQGLNFNGEVGYAGPKPPPGKTHRYFFQLFALDTVQDIPNGADRATVKEKFKGHVLSQGLLIGTYTGPEEKK